MAARREQVSRLVSSTEAQGKDWRSEMRRLGRTGHKDGNHAAVVKALEDLGWYVIDTSGVGYGCPDVFAVKDGRIVPIEIKDPKSSRGLKLSAKEAEVHAEFKSRGVHVELLTDTGPSLDPLKQPARNFYGKETER